MKLILDFDRVLFNHDAFVADVEVRSLDGLYAHPDLWNTLRPSDYLYKDVIPFLQQYASEDMVIISAYTGRLGPHAESYQTRKVCESGVQKHIADIVIMDGSKVPDAAPFVEDVTVFVDDKRVCVEEMCRAYPEVTCVQLLRPKAVRTKNDIDNADNTLPIPVVQSLSEVSAIIEAL